MVRRLISKLGRPCRETFCAIRVAFCVGPICLDWREWVWRAISRLDQWARSTILIPEIEMYEALVEAGVSKDKARDVVLAQKEAMDQILTTLATKTDLAETKTDLAEFRTHVDGRFNLVAEQMISMKAELAEFRTYVDGRFDLVAEQMTSMMNKIVIRLGALAVVLTGLLGTLLALMHR